MKLRIATRRSNLALAQTRWVGARIRAARPDVTIEEVQVMTEGDRVLDQPLMNVGGKGLFVTEVEAAIADGRADIAVHSMKDVPNELGEGLYMACIPVRADPRDLLVTADGSEIGALETGSRVGTSSLRRASQLKAHRPDLDFGSLRGNVETRLKRLDEDRFRAIVLAKAGLERLGLLSDRPHWIIPPNICLPAVGQGALGIEARRGDDTIAELLAPLEDPTARIEVEAERAVLNRLEGSCKVPIAGHARFTEAEGRLEIHAMVGALDGSQILSGGSEVVLTERDTEERIAAARAIGTEVADGLLAKGAAKLIREAIAAVERAQKQGNGGRGTLGFH